MLVGFPISKKGARDVFKYDLTQDVLLFLVTNRYHSFSISDIAKAIGRPVTDLALRNTVDLLDAAGVVLVRKEKKKKLVRINMDFLFDPKDVYLQIPQDEFRPVVKCVVERILSASKKVDAIILFGKVAGGEADRMSDIDLLVVSSDKELDAALAGISREASVSGILGERYSISPYLESIKSLKRLVKDNEPVFANALREGLCLYSSERFEKWLREVII